MGCCCCWGNSQWLAYKWSDTKQCVHCRQWINNACARRRHQLFIVIDIERYVHCLVDLTVMQKSANLSVVVALSIDIAIVRNTAPSFSTNHLQCIDMALIPGLMMPPLYCLHYTEHQTQTPWMLTLLARRRTIKQKCDWKCKFNITTNGLRRRMTTALSELLTINLPASADNFLLL